MYVIRKSGLGVYNDQIRFYYDGTNLHSAWPQASWPEISFTRRNTCLVHNLRADDAGLSLSDLTPFEAFLMPDPVQRVAYTCMPLPQIYHILTKLWNCPIDGLLSPTTRSNLVPLVVPRTTYQSRLDYVGTDRPVLIVDMNETETFPTKYMESAKPRDDFRTYIEQGLFNWLYEYDLGT